MKHIMRTLALLALLAPIGACGAGNESDGVNSDGTSQEHDGSAISEPAAFCDSLAHATCSKLEVCFTAEERAAGGMPATEEECLDRALSLCTPQSVCPAGSTYQPQLAGACIVEVESLTCEDLADPGLDEPESACAEMCK